MCTLSDDNPPLNDTGWKGVSAFLKTENKYNDMENIMKHFNRHDNRGCVWKIEIVIEKLVFCIFWFGINLITKHQHR